MRKIHKKTIKRIITLILCVSLVVTNFPDSFISAIADEINSSQVVEDNASGDLSKINQE